jgi:Protein of unknown function (DUF4197)
MKKLALGIGIIFIFFSSCELLEEASDGLSLDEVVEGLKTALKVGSDTSSTILSKADGYYGDALVKIPLPPEAENIRTLITNNNVANLIDLDQEFENVVKSINRAAEEAAKDAAPVFKTAIDDMSISDGWDILNGTNPASTLKSTEFDSTAATGYFKTVTKEPLIGIYAPKINTALGNDLGLGFSATEAWTTLTSNYNDIMGQTAVQLALTLAGIDMPSEMNDDLGEYATEKAINGVYYKVGQEEIKIRRDPWAWASTTVGDILEKVFGDN